MSDVRQGPLTVGRDDLLVDGSDAAFRDMLHDLLAFSARLEQIRSRFGGFIGLTGVAYTILVTIRQLQGDGGVAVKDVARHLGFSSPFVTAETNKLAKIGIVEKRPDQTDQRKVDLRITDKGVALLTDLATVQSEVNDLLFEPVTAENFAAVRRLAADLRQSADKAARLSGYLFGIERDEE